MISGALVARASAFGHRRDYARPGRAKPQARPVRPAGLASAAKFTYEAPRRGIGCARLVRAAMPVFNPRWIWPRRRAQAVHGMKAAMTGMEARSRGGKVSGVGRRFRRAGGVDRRFRPVTRGRRTRRLRAPAAGDRLAPRFERRAGGRRTAARGAGAHRSLARSLGCENRKFLFFGSNPPAQCGEVNGQIARMQANLADLQARAGGGGRRSRRPL